MQLVNKQNVEALIFALEIQDGQQVKLFGEA
jgi:hypothetical protein